MRGQRLWNWLKGERARPLRDIGGIVLGVLIALGIGEIADDIRWRYKVSDSETAMRAELGSLRRTLKERIAINGCIESRLDAIGAILQEARRGRPIPVITNYARPPTRLIENTSFEVAREEGVSLHMPTARWRMYAAAYSLAYGRYAVLADPERTRWDMLRFIEGNPGAIEPGMLSTLSIAWLEAKAYARRQNGLAEQVDKLIEGLGIPIDWSFDADPGDARNLDELRRQIAQSAMCKPLTAPGTV